MPNPSSRMGAKGHPPLRSGDCQRCKEIAAERNIASGTQHPVTPTCVANVIKEFHPRRTA